MTATDKREYCASTGFLKLIVEASLGQQDSFNSATIYRFHLNDPVKLALDRRELEGFLREAVLLREKLIKDGVISE